METPPVGRNSWTFQLLNEANVKNAKIPFDSSQVHK
jgi:hypothetical protein